MPGNRFVFNDPEITERIIRVRYSPYYTKLYNDYPVKDRILLWNEIAEYFNNEFTVQQLKDKCKHLTKYYGKELEKLKQDNSYKSKWQFFDLFQFLLSDAVKNDSEACKTKPIFEQKSSISNLKKYLTKTSEEIENKVIVTKKRQSKDKKAMSFGKILYKNKSEDQNSESNVENISKGLKVIEFDYLKENNQNFVNNQNVNGQPVSVIENKNDLIETDNIIEPFIDIALLEKKIAEAAEEKENISNSIVDEIERVSKPSSINEKLKRQRKNTNLKSESQKQSIILDNESKIEITIKDTKSIEKFNTVLERMDTLEQKMDTIQENLQVIYNQICHLAEKTKKE